MKVAIAKLRLGLKDWKIERLLALLDDFIFFIKNIDVKGFYSLFMIIVIEKLKFFLYFIKIQNFLKS